MQTGFSQYGSTLTRPEECFFISKIKIVKNFGRKPFVFMKTTLLRTESGCRKGLLDRFYYWLAASQASIQSLYTSTGSERSVRKDVKDCIVLVWFSGQKQVFSSAFALQMQINKVLNISLIKDIFNKFLFQRKLNFQCKSYILQYIAFLIKTKVLTFGMCKIYIPKAYKIIIMNI